VQRRFEALQQEASTLRFEAQQLRLQAVATHTTLVVSQQQLATNLRRLYKQGDVSALAVMLGSDSLDDALSQIDSLNSVATQSERVVSVTTAARSKLSTLHTKLAVRRARIAAAVADARNTLETLSTARGARVAFITKLRTQERLKVEQIHALEARVQLAEQKSAVLQSQADTTPVEATAVPEPPRVESEPVSAPAPQTGGRTVTVSSTGYSLPGHTATGLPVGWGVVAVDPSVIPLGTKLTIPGYGEAVAADTGGGVRGRMIDVWFPTLAQARAWGRRTVTITLH